MYGTPNQGKFGSGYDYNNHNQSQVKNIQQDKQDLNDSFDEADIRVTSHEKDYEVTTLMDFRDADFPPEFYQVIGQLKFERPTYIQKYAIPVALEGKDLIGIAKTGSGKTLAFMLPGIQTIIDEKNYVIQNFKHLDNRNFPMGLVLAPTRELAIQIYEASLPFARKTGIDIRVIYGGQESMIQKKKLNEGVDIQIATPGRQIDFIERGIIRLNSKLFYLPHVYIYCFLFKNQKSFGKKISETFI